MEDFAQPKVMYPNMTKYMPFYYDIKGFFQNDKSFMITGENIAFLTAFLNSSLFKFCFRENFPELQGGTRELRKIFFDKIPVLRVSRETNAIFANLIERTQTDINHLNLEQIDTIIFDLYELSDEERRYIGFVEIQ